MKVCVSRSGSQGFSRFSAYLCEPMSECNPMITNEPMNTGNKNTRGKKKGFQFIYQISRFVNLLILQLKTVVYAAAA